MISIEIDASEPVAALNVLLSRMQDFTEPLTEILTLALGDAAAEVSGGSGGALEAWPAMHPLTPVVAQVLYGRDRDPMTLLMATGALAASLVPGGSDNLLEVGPTEGEAGTANRAARFQQDGTARTFHVLQGEGFSETGIPERPFLGWREERLDDYAGVFATHLFLGVDEAA